MRKRAPAELAVVQRRLWLVTGRRLGGLSTADADRPTLLGHMVCVCVCLCVVRPIWGIGGGGVGVVVQGGVVVEWW